MNTVKLLIILGLVLFVTLVGVMGYSTLEGWSYFDSLYMTVITLTTTGYQEVKPMSDQGRAFTMVLLLCGMGLVAYSISALMSYLVNFDFAKRRREKMIRKIESLEDHTVICGFGRMGEVVCQELMSQGQDFVVIESEPKKIEMLKKLDYLYVQGDAANDENLEACGVDKAQAIVSMIDNDADALYVTLSARSLNPNIYVIVRGSDERAKKRILRAGADKVVLPVHMSGVKVAECVINPAVEDFLELTGLTGGENKRFQLADLIVTEKSSLAGKTLKEAGPQMRELIVVGIRKADGSFHFYPDSQYLFEQGDCLITMGEQTSYLEAKEIFNLSAKTPFKRSPLVI